MAVELGTLAQLKAKLGIAADDESRDDELNLALSAARAYVLARTRYALEAGEVSGEVHEYVREGSAVWTRQRPLDPDEAVVVEGRVFGSTDWSTLAADVIDAERGKLRVTGALSDSRARPWVPSAWPGALLRRHRAWRWDVVRLAYTTAEPTGLEALSQVVVGLAAVVVTDPMGAIAQTVGQVSETFAAPSSSVPTLPGLYEALLAPYVWPKAQLAS